MISKTYESRLPGLNRRPTDYESVFRDRKSLYLLANSGPGGTVTHLCRNPGRGAQ